MKKSLFLTAGLLLICSAAQGKTLEDVADCESKAVEQYNSCFEKCSPAESSGCPEACENRKADAMQDCRDGFNQ